jgi:hypothetical protein
MRAIKDKYGNLQLIDRAQASIFNKLELNNFLELSKLSERDLAICEDMHKRNILQKIKKGHSLGYRTYAQRSII